MSKAKLNPPSALHTHRSLFNLFGSSRPSSPVAGPWRAGLLFAAPALVLAAPVVRAQATAPRVAEVVIEGNQKIPTDSIQAILSTKVGGDFSETAMNLDTTRIRNMGYFYEDSVDAHAVPTANGMRVIFSMREHPVITQIVITGNTAISSADIIKHMKSKVGEVMNTQTVDEDTALGDTPSLYGTIARLYFEKGYQAIPTGLPPEQLINAQGVLTIPVIELVVQQVKIIGLHKTKPQVILRELKTKPGTLLNEKTLRRDQERVFNLDLFENVEWGNLERGSDDSKVIVPLQVKEKKTGQISLGLGFSAPQGIVGQIELSETNFRGRGEGINFLSELGGNGGRSSFELGFYEPYLDRSHDSMTVSLFSRVIYRFANNVITGPSITNNTDQLFNETRQGATLNFTHPFSDHSKGTIGFRTENVNLHLPPSVASDPTEPAFIRQDGNVTGLSGSYLVDTRDLITDPARGGLMTFNLEGGHANVKTLNPGAFSKYSFDLRRYIGFGKRKKITDKLNVLAARVEYGGSTGVIPFVEQYFVGGADTLRGYLESRFWGRQFLLGNVEFRHPFSPNITGVVFTDFGDAWGTQYQLTAASDPRHRFLQNPNFQLHQSVGFGVRLSTPIGPLRLDYGIGSEGGHTHFSIGHAF